MNPAVLPAGHSRAEVLILGRRIAADLAAEAVDPTSALPMTDRMGLAVEAEAARRADVEPVTAEALLLLADALAWIEAAGA